MKFVDEVSIHVVAGSGGNGCLSFLRERSRPRGGPDGGDGGAGGSIFFRALTSINTLVDYRYRRIFTATSGRAGAGKNRHGASGQDLELTVPVGTVIFDTHTGEVLGDLDRPDARLMVARGGRGGLGNTRFKSSTNRIPRQTTDGVPGEERDLRLEMSLLADVGLLGLPNAGKSSLLGAVSHAHPKVADYPFTTLYPGLGVVRLEAERSFVVADIPGLLPGAAQGVGLGTRFLKHLGRTRLLLHLVDAMPPDGCQPAEAAQKLAEELAAFSPLLASRERWLVLNKIDLQSEEECQNQMDGLCRLPGVSRVFAISALRRQGLKKLCGRVMEYLEDLHAREAEDAESGRQEREIQRRLHEESASTAELRRGQIEVGAEEKRKADDQVEIVYRG